MQSLDAAGQGQPREGVLPIMALAGSGDEAAEGSVWPAVESWDGSEARAPGHGPVYRIHVFCCTNERPKGHRRGCCVDKGSRALCDYMCRRGMALGARRIRINHAGCMNVCEHGPAMVIYPDGVWYKYASEADIDEILKRHVLGGKLVDRLLLHIDPSTIHG